MGDTAVRDVMSPRVDILGVEKATPWSEVVDRVRSAEHARLPVYDESLDEIVGILYAKDLLPAIVAVEAWVVLGRPAIELSVVKRVFSAAALQVSVALAYLVTRAFVLPIRP